MEKSRIYKKLVVSIKWGVGLIFILIPLVFYPQFSDIFTTPKIVLFQALTEIVLCFWLALFFIDRCLKFPLTRVAVVLFLLLFILSVSAFLGLNTEKSLWGLMERGTGVILLWHLFALFLVITSLRQYMDFKWFATLNVVTGTVISVLAITQRFIWWPVSLVVSTFERSSATFSNAPFLAGYLLFIVFMSLWLSRETTNESLRRIFFIAALLNGYVIFLTGTRSAVVGLLAGGTILACFLIKRSGGIRAALAALIILVISCSVFIFTRNNALWQGVPGLNRFASISSEENLAQRFVLWSVALDSFKKYPIVGWGWENFDLAFLENYHSKKYNTPLHYNFIGAPDKPYNIFLEYLVSGGILGFLGLVGVLVLVSRNLIYNPHSYAPFLTAALGAYLVNNLAIFDTIATYPLIFALFAFSHNSKPAIPQTAISGPKEKRLDIFLISILILCTAFIFVVNWRSIYTSREHYLSLRALSKERNVEKSLIHFENALRYRSPYTGKINFDYATEARRAFDEGVEYPSWEKFHIEIVKKLEYLSTILPPNPSFLIELGNSYNSFSQFNPDYVRKGNDVLLRAFELIPSNPKIQIAFAKNALLRGEKEVAFDYFARASQLDPNLSHPRILLSLLYKQLGNEVESYKEVTQVLKEGHIPLYTQEFIAFGDLYADLKEYRKALEFYEGALRSPRLPETREEEPLKINTGIKMGLIYNLLGENVKSKEIFKNLKNTLLDIDPSAAARITKIIEILGF